MGDGDARRRREKKNEIRLVFFGEIDGMFEKGLDGDLVVGEGGDMQRSVTETVCLVDVRAFLGKQSKVLEVLEVLGLFGRLLDKQLEGTHTTLQSTMRKIRFCTMKDQKDRENRTMSHKRGDKEKISRRRRRREEGKIDNGQKGERGTST